MARNSAGFPASGKADTLAGRPAEFPAAIRRLSKFPPGRENLHGACSIEGKHKNERHQSNLVTAPWKLPMRIIGRRTRGGDRVDVACAVRILGLDENSHRRGRSGVRSGSSPGERVCLSARPERTRNERPRRPSRSRSISPPPGHSNRGVH